jgi:hypothetical protein
VVIFQRRQPIDITPKNTGALGKNPIKTVG